VGCFGDKSIDRDFPYEKQISNMKTSDCISECASNQYSYAGTQNDLCYCGYNFGKYGSSKCRQKCPGDKNDICGENNAGSEANSVYEILCKLIYFIILCCSIAVETHVLFLNYF